MILRIRLLLSLTLLSFAPIHAQIVTYNPTGLPSASSQINATGVDPNITATALTRGAGLTAENAPNALNSSGFNDSLSFAASNSNGDYYTFTLTPAANYSIGVTAVSASGLRSASNNTQQAQWGYTTGGVTTALGTAVTVGTTATSISASSLTISGITQSIEFRINGWNGSNNGTFRMLASETVTGTVSLRSAGTLIWDGGQANGNWNSYTGTASNQSNWNLNNLPTTALVDALQFAGSTQTTTNNNITGLTTSSITFNSGASSFTNSGNSLTLTGGITNNSANLQTINHPIILSTGNHSFDTTGASLTIGGQLSGTGASLTKAGPNTLTLGNANTYSGDTAINNGTIQLTTGNDRLPTTTTLTLGQASTTNLGTLDLNGRSQQIAGLNSITGTNATASNNTVTSATTATLTLGGSGSYSFGDGTNANSGVITGAINLLKTGLGTQTLGDSNTYSGGTTISGGTLNVINGSGSATGTGALTLDSTGTLSGTGIIAPATNTNINLNGSLIVGNSTLGSPVASSITLSTSGSGVTTTSTTSLFHFDLFTRIGGANPLGSAADYIKLPGTLDNTSVGPNLGTIVITNRTGSSTFALGDSWHLFDFQGTGSITDDFNVDASDLDLSSLGLIGQFDRLSGTFSIVPEPSRTLFLALGLLTLTLRRRR